MLEHQYFENIPVVIATLVSREQSVVHAVPQINAHWDEGDGASTMTSISYQQDQYCLDQKTGELLFDAGKTTQNHLALSYNPAPTATSGERPNS